MRYVFYSPVNERLDTTDAGRCTFQIETGIAPKLRLQYRLRLFGPSWESYPPGFRFFSTRASSLANGGDLSDITATYPSENRDAHGQYASQYALGDVG